MCLLTYFPENIQPDLEALLRGAKYNSDGHGFAIVVPATKERKARILVRKAMKPVALIKQFAILREMYPDGPALFHSRITTDGATDLFNCHPFMKGGDKRTVIGHNGILPKSVRPTAKDPRSDTRIFAEEAANGFRLHTAMGRTLAGEWMGSYNKVAILTIDPLFDQYGYIINEKEGEWHKGIWYSNTSYRGYRASSVIGGKGYYSDYGDYEYYVSNSTKGTWVHCTATGCKAKSETVSPYTKVCTMCGVCDICDMKPCECRLEAVSGKGISPPWESGAGAGVSDGRGWPGEEPPEVFLEDGGEEALTVDQYIEALSAAEVVGDRIKIGGYMYGDDLDTEGDETRVDLQEAIDLITHLNAGGDIDDWPEESAARQMLNAHLERRLGRLTDTTGMDLVKTGDPDDDQESLINSLFGEDIPPAGSFHDHPGDDVESVVIDGVVYQVDEASTQDVMIHEGVKYAVS